MTHPDPDLCDAKLLYHGRTRAKCYFDAGHRDFRHYNGTVWWTDQTPGAVPATTRPALERLEVLLRTWLDDDDATTVASWIVADPETVAAAAFEYFEEGGYPPVVDVKTDRV